MYSEDTPEPWRHGEDGCKGSEKNTPMFPASGEPCNGALHSREYPSTGKILYAVTPQKER